MKKFTFCLIFVLCGSLSLGSAHDVASSMAAAAEDFLLMLSDEQRAQASYELDDPERKDWHYIPKPFEGEGVRGGVPLRDMNAAQRHLAYALLSTGLSHKGYVTALQIMSLEQVLWELENEDPKRDASMYYVSVFGEPGAKNWGWRVEGHHLSMNFTIADGDIISGTPVFFASNPGVVEEGPRKGLRVLAAEEDVARKLAKSLDEQQQGKAIILDKAPREILTAAKPAVDPLEGGGLNYTEMTEAQKKQLYQLMDVYLGRMREDVALAEWTEIKEAGLDQVVFAWAGSLEPYEPHYYRVQGPTFLLEYANTQNGAKHVHSVYRQFDGDFGEDLLRAHYAEHHAGE